MPEKQGDSLPKTRNRSQEASYIELSLDAHISEAMNRPTWTVFRHDHPRADTKISQAGIRQGSGPINGFLLPNSEIPRAENGQTRDSLADHDSRDEVSGSNLGKHPWLAWPGPWHVETETQALPCPTNDTTSLGEKPATTVGPSEPHTGNAERNYGLGERK